MKNLILMLVLFTIAGAMSAQGPKNHPKMAQRKFQILVENEKNIKTVQETNDYLQAFQESSRGEAQRGLLGDLLWTGYTSAFKQKTVNATSNLISLGLSYIGEAIKGDREKWYRKAQEQCYYHQLLSAETQINDFYALPSTKGAMDPENLKFEGFGCKNYIEVVGDSKEGVGVFYIFCKMRRDSIGLRHIVNHSKFMVEVDSLVFNPKYCNLPNDSTGDAESRFDFDKRDNLNLELKVRFYSSWMNQAMILVDNQKLGEFTIKVNIDKNKLNTDSLFIYDKNDPDFEKLVSIDGDCFIVPRSYTGTIDGLNYQPSWGTGQYRLEMEVSERCRIVDSYYQIREAGKGEIVSAVDATPDGDMRNAEKWKWDKAKWKVEWKAMNTRRKESPLIDNVWKCIVDAYKGNGWMATLTDPAATALYSWETQKLGAWIDDMHDKLFENSSAGNGTIPSKSADKMPNINADAISAAPSSDGKGAKGAQGEIPKGDTPMGGGKPFNKK